MNTRRSGALSLWPLLAVLAAGSVAVLSWLEPPRADRAGPAALGGGTTGSGAPVGPALVCPPDQLPDDGVCIPVPAAEETTGNTPTPLELLPGRTADYGRYLTPIAAYPASRPAQGLGIFIAAPRGVPVTAITLEAQAGTTRRWVTGAPPQLFTLHRVERGGATRSYVLSYDGLTFDMSPGLSDVAVGTPLGRVAPRPGVTGLSISARQVRRGVEPESLSPERLLLDSSSLDCDLRNVLPVKPAP